MENLGAGTRACKFCGKEVSDIHFCGNIVIDRTSENLIEAKDAEIASLRASGTDLIQIAVVYQDEIASLRAELADTQAVLRGALTYTRQCESAARQDAEEIARLKEAVSKIRGSREHDLCVAYSRRRPRLSSPGGGVMSAIDSTLSRFIRRLSELNNACFGRTSTGQCRGAAQYGGCRCEIERRIEELKQRDRTDDGR